ncbi:hypothetical protein PSEUDO8Z_90144 [Pseudomonas sp. 8Z]|nr:hypothetical protein PSEUDO8Z_90144 [Pseudomonas sp. 8Z]
MCCFASHRMHPGYGVVVGADLSAMGRWEVKRSRLKPLPQVALGAIAGSRLKPLPRGAIRWIYPRLGAVGGEAVAAKAPPTGGAWGFGEIAAEAAPTGAIRCRDRG